MLPLSCAWPSQTCHWISPYSPVPLRLWKFYRRKGVASSTIKSCRFNELPPLSLIMSTVYYCLYSTVYCLWGVLLRVKSPKTTHSVQNGYGLCHDPSLPTLFSNPSLHLLLKGITRSYSHTSDMRLPITVYFLHWLVTVLRHRFLTPHIDRILHGFLWLHAMQQILPPLIPLIPHIIFHYPICHTLLTSFLFSSNPQKQTQQPMVPPSP